MQKSLVLALLAILLTGCEKQQHEKKSEQKEVTVSEMTIADEEQLENPQNRDFTQHLGKDKVSFGFDKYNITDLDKEFLDNVVEYLNLNIDLSIEIQGNCDIRGSKDYNIGLGERRANAVATYLNKKGVSSERMTVTSFGARVIVPGDTEEVYAQNRVSIIVIK